MPKKFKVVVYSAGKVTGEFHATKTAAERAAKLAAKRIGGAISRDTNVYTIR